MPLFAFVVIVTPFLFLTSQVLVFGASVTQDKVNTDNSALDSQIKSFYKCVSDTHKDPPSIQTTDTCFFSNVHAGHMFFVGPIRIHVHSDAGDLH